MTASPGPIGPSGMASSARPGPAARWMAPATPPPGESLAFAALTTASMSSWAVMSPPTHSTVTAPNSRLIRHLQGRPAHRTARRPLRRGWGKDRRVGVVAGGEAALAAAFAYEPRWGGRGHAG